MTVDLPHIIGPRPARFHKTRDDHSSESASDYAELIDELHRALGEVRIVDLALHLGTSHATVVETVRRMARDGYVVKRPYRAVFLTDQGRRLAADARERHETVRSLLRALGVPPDAAEHDAEGIEHHVGPETLAAFRAFLRARGICKQTEGDAP